MVSYLELKRTLARNFCVIFSTFFLLNLEFSAAFTPFKITNDGLERGHLEKEVSYSKLGEACESKDDCIIEGSVCDEITQTCQCHPKLPVVNGIKCAKSAFLNESCQFDEQCEFSVWNSMCGKKGFCICLGNGSPVSLPDGSIKCIGKQFGDSCSSDNECGFKWAICDPNKRNCQCRPDLVATNHIDKCGEVKRINEECFFNEQCEQMLFDTICLNGKCSCRSERTPLFNADGTIKCIVVQQPSSKIQTDPTMIIVLSVMCLMFIIICVVLHLFSKARWRENRTIFNTPNPRLMNVSLLREKKNERRGSKEGNSSIKGPPSREPSMASLRQHSPTLESRNVVPRRESRGTASNGSARSPTSKDPLVKLYCDTPFTD